MTDPITLVGLPWDANSSYLVGCAAGPTAIRAALSSGSANEATEAGIDVMSRLDDVGDLELDNEIGSESDADRITEKLDGLFRDRRRPISLGGDHAVTYPILRAARRHYDDLTVVHIDAHPDLYDDFGGNRLSHASPFARALEESCMRRLVQLGIRTANPHGRRQADRFGVEMVAARELDRFDPASLVGPIYLSIDLDGLDPSEAPGVSHHEPGGLTMREVLTIVDEIPSPLVGADVVELNPSRDVVGMTAMVAAKLVKEIAGRMIAGSD